MKKVLLCASVLLCLAVLCGAACADSYVIFPYTNIAAYNSELHAGDVLAMITNDGETDIVLSGSGGMVYFTSTDFVPGDYSKGIDGTKTQTFRVSKPDAMINIQIYDVSGSELARSHGVSLDQGLVFKVTPYISQVKPKALLFETKDNGVTTFFGTKNSAVGTDTGLKLQPDGSYTFTVKNLREAGVTKGNWDVRVLFDRDSFIGNVPDELLRSSSYNEQMTGKTLSPTTYTPDPILVKTVVPTVKPTAKPTPVPTPQPVSTPQKAVQEQPAVIETEACNPVPVETPAETTAPASPLPLAGLAAGLFAAALVLRKH
jgi:Predicted solute binding protein